ncbi:MULTISPECIES: class I SAM-dependent methyltransferase [unclassified Arthrobacter]|uniref:class I SAM-dependent methyltransferase n=1 Tax=unclassified Arthrobacter TaxID=235627 RepID=UPI0014911C23|nr:MULTISPECIES: class I SAM-dependent methyltransferase [unclassified Arthrobacter]MBE0010290.1 methyltransferase domain-containing protein [Arthrobacter sp. AET 35A]NOJ64167.1 class I SAM-dependent methyltransferase [Arthrobacter sp. 147(2020)]
MSRRYRTFARFYDALSGEYPVYRAGRELGIRRLPLQAGGQVLDVGCGTGLNFSLLQRRVSPGGTIVGIDSSPEMLEQARRRATRNGWTNVILIQADATTLSPADIGSRIAARGGRARSDAALATYSLSLMVHWETAWAAMVRLTTPEASLCIVDMQKPTGFAAVLTPLAQAACWLGGADIDAHPRTGLERDCADVVVSSARGGHLQIRVGRRQS